MDLSPTNQNTLRLNGLALTRTPSPNWGCPAMRHYSPPFSEHVLDLMSSPDYYLAPIPHYSSTDLVWIFGIQSARHHLEAQGRLRRTDPNLSLLLDTALYDSQDVLVHRGGEEHRSYRLAGAIGEHLLTQVEQLEDQVSSLVLLPQLLSFP